MLTGAKEHVEALREEVAAVIAPMGLRLSEEKTLVTHIDQGFDFLGFHIQRKRQQGSERRTVYTYPAKAALAAVKAKVRVLTQGNTDQTLANLLDRVNPVLRGWANYFRHGVSARTFDYLNAFSWRRVVNSAAPQVPPGRLGLAPSALPAQVAADGRRKDIVQPGYGADHSIPLPGGQHPDAVGEHRGGNRRIARWHELAESRVRGTRMPGSGERAGETTSREGGPAPWPDSYYWLVDLLQEQGAKVHLAPPLGAQMGGPAGKERRDRRHRPGRPAPYAPPARSVDSAAGGARTEGTRAL